MLYPDFNELVSYKARKLDKMQLARSKVHALTSGNHHSPFQGQGLDFDGVRGYVPGDDIRAIDWRVTARTGSPHIKVFKEDKERHTILCVDRNSAMRFGTRNTFKSVQAARCTALLGWRALAHQERITACFFGDVPGGVQYFGSKRTHKALCRMLKTLALPPTEEHHVSLETALQHICKTARPGSVLYLISDFIDLSPTFVQDSGLSRLHKSCAVVFISINDPLDQALFPAGIIGFCGKNGEKLSINTDSSKGREAYAAAWTANRKSLHSLTERFNIPLLTLSTEADIPRALLLGLKQIAKRKRCLR